MILFVGKKEIFFREFSPSSIHSSLVLPSQSIVRRGKRRERILFLKENVRQTKEGFLCEARNLYSFKRMIVCFLLYCNNFFFILYIFFLSFSSPPVRLSFSWQDIQKERKKRGGKWLYIFVLFFVACCRHQLPHVSLYYSPEEIPVAILLLLR